MGDDWNSTGNTWNADFNDNWDSGANGAATWNGDDSGAVDVNDKFNSTDHGGACTVDGHDDVAGLGSACRNCGQDGHFARECPEPRKLGPCFNCGEEGHAKAECPQPRVFKGQCNICSEEGHPAALCPSKPKQCVRCKQKDDHETKDCKNNYNLNLDDVADVPEGAAWAKIVQASIENDVDDFKDALRMLQKAAPELTYQGVEKKLRAQHIRFYLIALKKDVGDGYTLVNLQGEPGKSYSVAIFKSPNPVRPNMVDKWPQNVEENYARLSDAGIPMERGLLYCRTCSKFGHGTRECSEEKAIVEGPEIKCALCGEAGHRVRDCKEPRQKPREPRTCKICGSEDHIAKECSEKPVFKCRNCGGDDHKAADCTEPRKMICNNCDEEGHISKECSKPTDWSKVKCRHCGEMGHASANRCAPGAAKKDDENIGDNGDGQKTNGTTKATGNEWDDNNTASTGGEWNASAPAQTVTAGVYHTVDVKPGSSKLFGAHEIFITTGNASNDNCL